MSTSPGGGAEGGARASWTPCGAELGAGVAGAGGGGRAAGPPNPRPTLRDCRRPHQMRAWGGKTEDRALASAGKLAKQVAS